MATTQPIFDHFTNPVDMVEHIASIHAWTFERSAPDELTLTVSGTWCDYHISLTWRDDLEALHLACAFDCKVSKPRLNDSSVTVKTMQTQQSVRTISRMFIAGPSAVEARRALR